MPDSAPETLLLQLHTHTDDVLPLNQLGTIAGEGQVDGLRNVLKREPKRSTVELKTFPVEQLYRTGA